MGTDRIPVTSEMVLPGEGLRFIGISNENRTDRMSELISTGASKAGDCYSQIAIQRFFCAHCHRLRHWGKDCAMGGKECDGDGQQIGLGLVAIADDATFIDRRCTGNSCKGCSDAAGSNALSGSQGLPCQAADYIKCCRRHDRKP